MEVLKQKETSNEPHPPLRTVSRSAGLQRSLGAFALARASGLPVVRQRSRRRKADKVCVGRWNCHSCKSSFNILSGTLFSGTHLPLQTWFLAIALMVYAKKSLLSHQLARDLELTQRIRAAVATDEGILLQGLIEADETLGRRPTTLQAQKQQAWTPHPQGAGTGSRPIQRSRLGRSNPRHQGRDRVDLYQASSQAFRRRVEHH